jgi:hypothetical protein
MSESILDAPFRVLTFPVATDTGGPLGLSTAVVETSGVLSGDCPDCGKIGSAKVFRTVYAAYFFCSSCACAWSVEQLLPREHRPERRRFRPHRTFGERSV